LKSILPPGVTILWAKALGNAIIHGFALLMGVTLLLPPATILRALVQEEVSTYTFLGRSSVAVVICAMVKLECYPQIANIFWDGHPRFPLWDG
jgi:hypothetical protein